jgi:hypothetical protein
LKVNIDELNVFKGDKIQSENEEFFQESFLSRGKDKFPRWRGLMY